MRVRTLLVLFALFLSCGSDSPSGAARYNQPSSDVLFSATVARVTIEVDYVKGAEPYTGSLGTFGDTWALFRTNAARVFQRSPKALVVPTTLEAMEAIDVKGTTFTTDQILAIADAHRDAKNSA